MKIFPKSLEELAQCVPTKPLPDMNHLYHFTSLESFLKIWGSQKLLLTKREYMNDSAEQDTNVRGIGGKVYACNYAVSEYYQLSLSKAYKDDEFICYSPLMWGLYADKSKGVCIELDKDKLNLDSKDYIVGNIAYTEMFNNIIVLNENEEINSIDDARRFIKQEDVFSKIFLSKNRVWEFENEFRVLSNVKPYLDIKGAITRIFIFKMPKQGYDVLRGILPHSIDIRQIDFYVPNINKDVQVLRDILAYDYRIAIPQANGNFELAKQIKEEFKEMLVSDFRNKPVEQLV